MIVDLVVAPSPQLDARRQLVRARDARVVLREDFTEICDGARRVLTRRRVDVALSDRIPMRVVVRFRSFPIRSDRRLESDNAPSAVEILRVDALLSNGDDKCGKLPDGDELFLPAHSRHGVATPGRAQRVGLVQM